MKIEYKTDGSFREFRNHFLRRTKEDLVRELWRAQDEIDKLRQVKRNACTLECGAYGTYCKCNAENSRIGEEK